MPAPVSIQGEFTRAVIELLRSRGPNSTHPVRVMSRLWSAAYWELVATGLILYECGICGAIHSDLEECGCE